MSIVLAVAVLGALVGLHIVGHGLARHLVARALCVNGTRPLRGISDAAAYGASPGWARVVAAAAGPIANYVLCALCFFAAVVAHGDPVTTTVVKVVPSWPAAAAGLRDGDRLIAVDDAPIADFDHFGQLVRLHGKRDRVVVQVARAGRTLRFPVELRDGKVGVTAVKEVRPVPLGVAARTGLISPLRVLWERTTSFAENILRREPVVLTGPIGIVANAPQPDPHDQAFHILTLLGIYSATAWPLWILVAFLINRPRAV